MRREQLEHLIRAAGNLLDEAEFCDALITTGLVDLDILAARIEVTDLTEPTRQRIQAQLIRWRGETP